MVSTTFKHESEINITLPSASNKTVTQKPDAINIGLDLKGNIYIDGKRLINSEFKTIKSALFDRIKKSEKPPVIISADSNVKYQSVIYLLDTLRQLELVKITYATQILKDKEK
jgi:biopolymer transport protein ExbD